ncbi:hypothetical protein CHLRE_03g208557v5 [Chlamydomonas reinhardtii]|uniref:Uncharacterized protein n=1 Tax=Chlamydomonas reinhardtii TaxID=3055 RepID=A0A2K3DYU8_CHLRE|nr:uncharacterized protein CHLRE_03g208557v5 [Chlamydomonas reinhardtii]PNW85716.1 hypothetical protein CHLRE_03g208557v5 [Chlamydomonas reinhardtii]
MKEAKGRRARSATNTGVVSYAGQQRRVHYFLIEYPDGACSGRYQCRAAVPPPAEELPSRGVSLPESTPSELECLSELIDLSQVTSIYAPLNVPDATMVWDGIGMNVIWLEVDPATADTHVETPRDFVTDAVIARVPREYMGKARLSWLRKRRASGELLIASCATCVWLVLLSKGIKRWGFVTAMSAAGMATHRM